MQCKSKAFGCNCIARIGVYIHFRSRLLGGSKFLSVNLVDKPKLLFTEKKQSIKQDSDSGADNGRYCYILLVECKPYIIITLYPYFPI